MHISRHVVFHEDIFPFSKSSSASSHTSTRTTSLPQPLILVPASTVTHHNTSSPASDQPSPSTSDHSPNISRSEPSPTPLQPSAPSSHTVLSDHIPHPMQTRSKSGIHKPNPIYSLLADPIDDQSPLTYKQAVKHTHWRQAMAEELQALQNQHTWSLVSPPPNKPVLGCKWTFKTKLLPSGKVDRYKARLVALGNHQQFGENYTETFSPVAKMPTIRLLLTLALNRQWEILQLDVSNAFLHGDLLEDIYMKQPQGFIDPNQPTAVCKLHKSLYGLKQASRQWFQKLTDFLQHRGFRFSLSDPSLLLYIKNSVQIYFLIYVDDIIVTGNNNDAVQCLLKDLHSAFALKQLGTINLFLGIQVQQHPQGLFLSQAHYAAKLLNTAGLTDCKTALSPMPPSSKHSNRNTQLFSDPSLYRRLAGSLQYLSITRPDIAFATNRVCQHMQSPTVQDYQDIKRILRYVKGTISFGLPILKGELHLHSYTDADWASDITDRKSVTGFCNFLGPTLISWSVKKQVTVAKSSTEAEYRALSADISEVLWLRRLAEELQLKQKSPTPVHCDNISAIAIAKNPVFHARTKHVEIDYQFIRQHIAAGNVQIHHIPSQAQIADILTKPLSNNRFQELRSKLTIQSANA
ncbi:Retrovirus-related Pol polyprotein from transposon TNT 1-94 [Dendrobium catenatum]|uniref:Retrovirus-related Pol polyprotein from transposon TNT 1-94 n=1 Tax=Dendrobium catenatum TaxID=906689 RepID=A0A2I0W211_9ASPA|nr:Retrovirus-related Pol polyprotein from transposon TNT 1-94 [Dendrobium catenatum]